MSDILRRIAAFRAKYTPDTEVDVSTLPATIIAVKRDDLTVDQAHSRLIKEAVAKAIAKKPRRRAPKAPEAPVKSITGAEFLALIRASESTKLVTDNIGRTFRVAKSDSEKDAERREALRLFGRQVSGPLMVEVEKAKLDAMAIARIEAGESIPDEPRAARFINRSAQWAEEEKIAAERLRVHGEFKVAMNIARQLSRDGDHKGAEQALLLAKELRNTYWQE